MHFSLVKFHPGPEPAASGFDDAILPLYFGFRRLGFAVEIRVNSLHPTATNILFGVNQYTRLPVEHIPNNTIIFNLEQLSSGDIWFTPQYVRILKEFQVWDYSARNCEGLRRRFGIHARHVRLGYVDEMTRIPAARPAVDVLFYGFLNKRRIEALDKLQRAGTRLFLPSGPLLGEERDRMIAQSALILNIHYHLPASLEVVRLGYLWANRKAVVSECGPDTEIPAGLETACIYSAYEDLVPCVERLLSDGSALRAQAEEGFRSFARLRQADILQEIVGARGHSAGGSAETWEQARSAASGGNEPPIESLPARLTEHNA